MLDSGANCLAHLTGALQPLHLIGCEGLWDYAGITGKPFLHPVRKRGADNPLGTFKKEAIELLAEELRAVGRDWDLVDFRGPPNAS